MAKDPKERNPRNGIAYAVLIVAGVIIIAIGITAIVNDHANIMPIFNVLLPVLASWIGTVLAFYFGRENFESANEQVRQLVQSINPDQATAQPVTSAMRFLPDIACCTIAKDKDEKSVSIKDMKSIIKKKDASRLPILDTDKKPKYMLHASSIDKYLAITGKTENDTLDDILTVLKDQFKMEFGLNSGFVLVSEKATLAEAKKKMDDIPFCQDIFVTKNGTPDEPLTGWISNLRLGKYTEA
jgi:hypothetical protein